MDSFYGSTSKRRYQRDLSHARSSWYARWITSVPFLFLLVLAPSAAWTQEPVVSGVTFSQGPNGATGTKVDIYYNLSYAYGNCTVSALLSKDNGVTFTSPVTTATGDIGANITPGNGKHIIWDIAADYPNELIAHAVIQVDATAAGTGGPYNIGYTTVTYQDPARSNRNVATKIYYPSATAGQDTPVAGGSGIRFPVIVFGHGFVMSIDSYPYIWESFVPQGYIVVMCNTETGILPNHTNFGRDLAFLANRLQAEGANSASRFYGKVAATSAVMGHSMGGGATFLSVQYSANITAIVTMAAAETNPSAISAAGSISVPALVLSGSQDCVAPPNTNQVPMYNALLSSCKYYVGIVGGSHCQFAVNSTICQAGEALPCIGRTFVDANAQRDLVIDTVQPWLDAKLKGLLDGRDLFLQLLAANAALGATTYQGTCPFAFSANSPSSVLDTVRPVVTSVAAQTSRTIQIAFSKIMLQPAVLTAGNYVLSGGTGNLSATPSNVTGSGPYVLTWTAGEMLDGRTITVTASQVQDSLGNLIGTPNSGDSIGIGTLPAGTLHIDAPITPGYTNSPSVNLSLSAADPVGVAKMRFSNDGAVWTPPDWASAVPYATTYSGWNLTSGDGAKTVYAQYLDNAGNISVATIKDSIAFDGTPPAIAISLTGNNPTGANVVTFGVAFSEPVAPTFGASVISLTGALSGTVQLSGADPDYSVAVSLDQPDTDGEVGISIGSGVSDRAGNTCPGGGSPRYSIFNWRGFSQNPGDIRAYTADSPSFEVVTDCGATALVYQWKWDDGKNNIRNVGSGAPQLPLDHVSSANEGEYWCEVLYDGTAYSSSHGSLTVRDHLHATPLEDQTLQQGAPWVLGVLSTGGYAPLRYIWTKDGVAIPDATSEWFTIPSLGADDAGTYAAEVTDSGFDVQTVSMKLTVTAGLPAARQAAVASALVLIILLGVCKLRERLSKRA